MPHCKHPKQPHSIKKPRTEKETKANKKPKKGKDKKNWKGGGKLEKRKQSQMEKQ
jgi:hypothetical protein